MQSITYFYSAHSAFAYLGSSYLSEVARVAKCQIVHKPIDLDRCVAAGGAPGFSDRSSAHVDYYFGQEINRWSEFRHAPVLGRIPTHHANDVTLANCMLIACEALGQSVDSLAHAFLEGHWRDDADLANRETVMQITQSAGYEAKDLFDEANSQNTLDKYQNNTEEAIQRSVFGSPTYFVDDEMFYGQDRLEFVARKLASK